MNPSMKSGFKLRHLRFLAVSAWFALAGCNFITGGLEDDGQGAADGGAAGDGESSSDSGANEDPGAGGFGTDSGGDTDAGPPDPSDDGDDGADTGADTGGAGTGTGGGDAGACCFEQAFPECGDPGIEACVCAEDPYCCEEVWDADCAAKVDELGCGFCGGGEPTPSTSCCTEHGGPGCDDITIQQCVCDIDAQCCNGPWDSVCVDLVSDGNCGDCGADPDAQPCCTPTAASGCAADPVVEQCVCDAAPECCSGPWTETCTQVATVTGCAQCGPYTPQEIDCCDHGVGPGCNDDPVETCVCAVDPYCCNVLWDDTCVAKVEDLACGTCPGA